LRRLRRTAELAARVLFVEDVLRAAINNFDQALPDLVKMRNVGKHFDEYVLNNPRRRYRDVQGGDLLVNRWNGTQYEWLGRSLNIDIAHQAAEELFIAVKLAYDDYLKAYPPECSWPSRSMSNRKAGGRTSIFDGIVVDGFCRHDWFLYRRWSRLRLRISYIAYTGGGLSRAKPSWRRYGE
jgi:hypothetical protein